MLLYMLLAQSMLKAANRNEQQNKTTSHALEGSTPAFLSCLSQWTGAQSCRLHVQSIHIYHHKSVSDTVNIVDIADIAHIADIAARVSVCIAV